MTYTTPVVSSTRDLVIQVRVKLIAFLEMGDYRINLPLGNDKATTTPYERSAST